MFASLSIDGQHTLALTFASTAITATPSRSPHQSKPTVQELIYNDKKTRLFTYPAGTETLLNTLSSPVVIQTLERKYRSTSSSSSSFSTAIISLDNVDEYDSDVQIIDSDCHKDPSFP